MSASAASKSVRTAGGVAAHSAGVIPSGIVSSSCMAQTMPRDGVCVKSSPGGEPHLNHYIPSTPTARRIKSTPPIDIIVGILASFNAVKNSNMLVAPCTSKTWLILMVATSTGSFRIPVVTSTSRGGWMSDLPIWRSNHNRASDPYDLTATMGISKELGRFGYHALNGRRYDFGI